MMWYDYWPQDGHGDCLKGFCVEFELKDTFNMILWSGRPLSDTRVAKPS